MKKGLWFIAGIVTAVLGEKYVWPKLQPKVTSFYKDAKKKVEEALANAKKKEDDEPDFEEVK